VLIEIMAFKTIEFRTIEFRAIKLLLAILLMMVSGFTIAVETVLLIRSDAAHLEKVVSGIVAEVDGSIKIEEVILEESSAANDLYSLINLHKPKAIVLVGNAQMRLYNKLSVIWFKNVFPPVVAVSELFGYTILDGHPNVVGVRYEVPAAISLLSLKRVLSKDVVRVGVLYRENESEMIKSNVNMCEKIGVELVSVALTNKEARDPTLVYKALNDLNSQSIDALWVANDRYLLTTNLVTNSWVPFSNGFNKSVVVGANRFVATDLNFGNIAIYPDDSGLGEQAGTLLVNLMHDDWIIKKPGFEYPVNLVKSFNVEITRSRKIDVFEEHLDKFDKLIK